MHKMIDSSPCIRGTLFFDITARHMKRFIPVHTGNTQRPHAITASYSVHPRAYGEHKCPNNTDVFIDGSSPCIRGTRDQLDACPLSPRFIPVHTGNTLRDKFSIKQWAVHPRACGEHFPRSCLYFSSRGSSPCIRGTL